MPARLRPFSLLFIVALLLLAGYVLQQFEGGDGAEPVPDAELTPAVTSTLLPGTPAVPAATATGAASNPAPAGGRDLRADEAQGGHTIARHVGRSDDQLRQRLRDEPDISAASTYPDLETAERVVGEVLAAKADEIQKWERRTGSRANLVLRKDLGRVVGRSIEQGESRAVECEDAVVVLRWTGNSWHVLTSYPEDR